MPLYPGGSGVRAWSFRDRDVARAVGGELHVRQDAPGFKRLVLMRQGEGLVIDLVKDGSPQLHPRKLERDNILIDPPDEIVANKLEVVVSRETR